jgi:ubiquinone/menaquinone biosynthesis C-methylase UbiE
MKSPPQDDPELVRREYADPSRFAARVSFWSNRPGPQPFDVAFDEIVGLAPQRVLEVGCGRGELAARLAATGIEVIAIDQSEQMVELARGLGVDARLGDVQGLEFDGDEFDVATANFMLYHVAEIDRALAELARVAPLLVATTNGTAHMKEMWDIVGRDLGGKGRLFMVETGEVMLRRHYATVRVVDASAQMEVTADAMRNYVANSVAHRHLADRVPEFEGTRTVTASTAVFVASRSI